MTRPAKWVIAGGTVLSQSDGQRHYVSAGEVARLHQLRDDEWVRWVYEAQGGQEPHLFPRRDGIYLDLRGKQPL